MLGKLVKAMNALLAALKGLKALKADLVLAALDAVVASQYDTVAEMKADLKEHIQEQHKVPGYIRKLACKYVDGLKGDTPAEVVANALEDLGVQAGA